MKTFPSIGKRIGKGILSLVFCTSILAAPAANTLTAGALLTGGAVVETIPVNTSNVLREGLSSNSRYLSDAEMIRKLDYFGLNSREKADRKAQLLEERANCLTQSDLDAVFRDTVPYLVSNAAKNPSSYGFNSGEINTGCYFGQYFQFAQLPSDLTEGYFTTNDSVLYYPLCSKDRRIIGILEVSKNSRGVDAYLSRSFSSLLSASILQASNNQVYLYTREDVQFAADKSGNILNILRTNGGNRSSARLPSWDARDNFTSVNTSVMERAYSVRGIPFRNSTTLQNGHTYYIENLHSGNYLDVTGNDSGANVWICDFNGNPNQTFRLNAYAYQNSGTVAYYTFTPVNNLNQRLDITGAASNNGANVAIWAANNSSAQKFRIAQNGDSSYSIVSQVTSQRDMVIESQGLDTRPGINCELYSYNGGNNQRWRFIDATGSAYSMKEDFASINLGGSISTGTVGHYDSEYSYRDEILMSTMNEAYTHDVSMGDRLKLTVSLENLTNQDLELEYNTTPVIFEIRRDGWREYITPTDDRTVSSTLREGDTEYYSYTFQPQERGEYTVNIYARFHVGDQSIQTIEMEEFTLYVQ